LNAKNIYFNGNIKLINKVGEQNIKSVNEKTLLNSRFWIAASTHEGEDDLCLKAHLKIKDKLEDIITIIAPRHIDRVIKIEKLCKKNNLNVQILSNNEKILKDKEIIIINSFGNLPEYFKYAKSVFIGKSTIKKLENVGGQNPIDAAKLGCKIYHGPYVYNFQEIYELFNQYQISERVEKVSELSQRVTHDLMNSKKINDEKITVINNLGKKILNDTYEELIKIYSK
jgi:3-deoxy-D-manno-octulosonic-acid transferase